MKIFQSIKWSLPLLLLLLIGWTACSKSQTDHKLNGRWNRVFVQNLTDTMPYEDWEFLGSEEFRIYYLRPGICDTCYIRGNYKLDTYRDVSLSGSMSEGFPGHYSGKWRIVKLKKDVLIMTKQEDPGGLTFREFVKL